MALGVHTAVYGPHSELRWCAHATRASQLGPLNLYWDGAAVSGLVLWFLSPPPVLVLLS